MNEHTDSLSGLRILCTQENALNCEMMKTMLSSAGGRVTVCNDREAVLRRLENAESDGFDVVLTDLPDTGQQAECFLEALRQRSPQLPVVIVGQTQPFEGYCFPVGENIVARIQEPMSFSQLENCLLTVL